MTVYKKTEAEIEGIWIETLRHSYQNMSLLLCPVTHSSKDLSAFTCFTSDSLPVSASTPLQISPCCDLRPKFPPWRTRHWPDLSLLLRRSRTFSRGAIQGMAATPLLKFAAQSQTSAQSRFASVASLLFLLLWSLLFASFMLLGKRLN